MSPCCNAERAEKQIPCCRAAPAVPAGAGRCSCSCVSGRGSDTRAGRDHRVRHWLRPSPQALPMGQETLYLAHATLAQAGTHGRPAFGKASEKAARRLIYVRTRTISHACPRPDHFPLHFLFLFFIRFLVV